MFRFSNFSFGVGFWLVPWQRHGEWSRSPNSISTFKEKSSSTRLMTTILPSFLLENWGTFPTVHPWHSCSGQGNCIMPLRSCVRVFSGTRSAPMLLRSETAILPHSAYYWNWADNSVPWIICVFIRLLNRNHLIFSRPRIHMSFIFLVSIFLVFRWKYLREVIPDSGSSTPQDVSNYLKRCQNVLPTQNSN